MMLHLSSLLLAATLGQAPAEPAWLDVVPAEADFVVRFKAVEPLRKDLVAMVKAMSPTLSAQAEPTLEQGIASFKQQLGDAATAEPFMMLVRVVVAEDPNQPPFAVVVRSVNRDAVIMAMGGGKQPTLRAEPDGYHTFQNPMGVTFYVAKKGDLVAVGPDKALVLAFTKSTTPSFTKRLSAASKGRFSSGDVGLCVNLAALTTRYAEPISLAKQGFMTALDQAGQQQGQAGMMEMVKSIYGGLFDSIKDADALVLSLDFAAEGLGIDGDLTVKPDSGAAKSIAAGKATTAPLMAKLPVDAAYYLYMNLDPKSFEAIQTMSLKMLSAGGKPSPELEAALAKQRGLGRVEYNASFSMAGGMRSLNVMSISDPKALLDTTVASIKAMTAVDSPLNFFKEVKFVPNAETYKGYTFTRTDMTVDKEKFAKLQPNNPGAGAMLTAMYGGDTITSWYGLNDTHVIQIIDKSWDGAKAQLDVFLGARGIGTTPEYKAVRSKLAKDVNFLGMLRMQGLVEQLAAQFGAMTNNPNLKPPAGMPKEPAFIGASITANAPASIEFHVVVPSAVGPVVEKGLVPMFQSLKPPGN